MNPEDIEKLAHLAKLKIGDETLAATADSITEVLKLVDQLQAVNTDGIAPMAHPLDAVQRLRADEAVEIDQRDRYQSIAPAVEDGLYLVPKVIE